MQMVAPSRCRSDKKFHHGFAVARIQISGGLVRQQDRGFPRQRASHSHALLLAAGKLRRIMPEPVRHSDALQRFHHSLLAVGGGHSLPVGQRQFHVLVNREIADQVETLKDETDFLVANARPLGEIQIFDRLVYSADSVQPVGVSSNPMMESSVDFPQPDGPDMATYSPLAIERCTPESACVSISSV